MTVRQVQALRAARIAATTPTEREQEAQALISADWDNNIIHNMQARGRHLNTRTAMLGTYQAALDEFWASEAGDVINRIRAEKVEQQQQRMQDSAYQAEKQRRKRQRRAAKSDFYVYVLKVDGLVRYIGKGVDDRHLEHMRIVDRLLAGKTPSKAANVHHQLRAARINGGKISSEIIVRDLNNAEACERERAMIESSSDQLWNVTYNARTESDL